MNITTSKELQFHKAIIYFILIEMSIMFVSKVVFVQISIQKDVNLVIFKCLLNVLQSRID